MDFNTPIDPDLLDESNSNIDEYLCCICQMIPNPQTALEEENCGHLFCNNCLTEWLKSKINCPICKKKISKRFIKDKNKIIYRQLMNLKLKCQEEKCDWKGIFTDYYTHLKNNHNIEINNNCIIYELYKYYKSSTHVHPLKNMDTMMDNGWYCDGKYLPSPCQSGILNVEQSKYFRRFRCVTCDYDMCEKCMNKYHDNKYVIKNDNSDNRCLYLLDKKYFAQIHEHPLTFLDKSEDNGWICYGKNLTNKCFSGINDTNQSKCIPRFKCEQCDFNLCENCMNFYRTKIYYEINKSYSVSIHSHPLVFLGVSDIDNWLCDGKDLKEKCLGGITDFYQTKGVERFRCDYCNYDLCKYCMDFYSLQNSKCNIF